MNNLYAVDISRSQFVKSDDIFGIVIFYFKEIYKLPVRFFRKIAADLHINPLVAPYRNKVIAVKLYRKMKLSSSAKSV